MLGGIASASLSRALLATEGAVTATAANVFSSEQKATVDLLAEMIIPTTDTPGALSAGVPDFIASIVDSWYTTTERNIFFDGLSQLNQFTQAQEDTPFHLASEAARIAALKDQEQRAANYQPPPITRMGLPKEDEQAPFFKKLRELVVLGYYTSEVGAKQELIYLPMPGYYDGNVNFADVGRQWIS